VDLLLEYGGGAADVAVTDVGSPTLPAGVPFDPAYPERVVDVPYGDARVEAILEQIGCEVAREGGLDAAHAEAGGVAGAGPWLVTPPSWRPDLTRAVDMVEEVARIAGYSQVPSVLPQAPAGPGLSKSQRLRRSTARSLADFGLVEVLSYPFVGEGVFDALGLDLEDPRRAAVRLANPLDAAAPLMRTEILQTLLGVARRNVGRGLTDVGLFELGLVTLRGAGELAAPLPRVDSRPAQEVLERLLAAVPPQPRHVAGVMIGQRERAGIWGPGRPADWADAVEAGHVIGRALHVESHTEPARRAPFHPGRCAALVVGGLTVGHAGELDPRVVKELGLPDGAAAFELDLDLMIEAAPGIQPARPVSSQPVAKEDLAFVVDQATPAASLVSAVRSGAGEFLEDVVVFDVYRGAQIPEDKKSVAVALRLRAPDHTLTPEEIGTARNGAVRSAAKNCGAELRS
jgi:phenylalanyl-tRNA synthetase beta chain